jgi:DNA repair exonuclease SbcCD ATPase subunit
MEETLIWVIGLAIEILLVAIVVLTVLLRRSRKAQQLLAQRADDEQLPTDHVVAAPDAVDLPAEVPAPPSAQIETPAEPLAVEDDLINTSPADAPQIELSEFEDDFSVAAEASVTNDLDQLLVTIDNANLDDSVERLQQRLEASNQSLQRLASELPQQDHMEVASLQSNLQEMSKEIDSLQHSNAQLKHDLRGQTRALEETAAMERQQKEMVLQHAKKLRGDIATLRDKLKDSQGDVIRLETEKKALAAEFAELNKEYERIYSIHK